jgi:SAM-dependent methyltransferase
MAVYISNTDLTTNFAAILEDVYEHHIIYPKYGVDAIICNFAIHYFCDTADHIRNIFNLVHKMLAPGGVFLFTCFDGKKIQKLLENGDYERKHDGVTKFCIKKKYDRVADIGMKIDVLLPFSKQEYYTEYLVNIDYLEKIAESKNMHLEICDSFSIKMDQCKHQNNQLFETLSEIDKEYIDLHSVISFRKKSKE